MGTPDILADYAPLCSAIVDPVVTALAQQQVERWDP
jgi:hypothetical protein